MALREGNLAAIPTMHAFFLCLTMFVAFDEGAHGVGNLIPQRVAHGFPPAKWPELLLEWLGGLPVR